MNKRSRRLNAALLTASISALSMPMAFAQSAPTYDEQAQTEVTDVVSDLASDAPQSTAGSVGELWGTDSSATSDPAQDDAVQLGVTSAIGVTDTEVPAEQNDAIIHELIGSLSPNVSVTSDLKDVDGNQLHDGDTILAGTKFAQTIFIDLQAPPEAGEEVVFELGGFHLGSGVSDFPIEDNQGKQIAVLNIDPFGFGTVVFNDTLAADQRVVDIELNLSYGYNTWGEKPDVISFDFGPEQVYSLNVTYVDLPWDVSVNEQQLGISLPAAEHNLTGLLVHLTPAEGTVLNLDAAALPEGSTVLEEAGAIIIALPDTAKGESLDISGIEVSGGSVEVALTSEQSRTVVSTVSPVAPAVADAEPAVEPVVEPDAEVDPDPVLEPVDPGSPAAAAVAAAAGLAAAGLLQPAQVPAQQTQTQPQTNSEARNTSSQEPVTAQAIVAAGGLVLGHVLVQQRDFVEVDHTEQNLQQPNQELASGEQAPAIESQELAVGKSEHSIPFAGIALNLLAASVCIAGLIVFIRLI